MDVALKQDLTCFAYKPPMPNMFSIHACTGGSSWLTVIVCVRSKLLLVLNMETYFASKNFSPSHPVSTESINWINLNAELVELVIPRSLFFNSKPFVWQLIKLLSNYPTFVQVMSFPTKLWWLRLDTITKSKTRQKSNFISCSEGPFVCKICCDLEFQQVNQPIVKVFPTRTNLSVHFHLFVSFIKLCW